MTTSYRRDRLTIGEASLLLLRAGKTEPGGAAVLAVSFSLLFAVIATWLGTTARHSLIPVSARSFFALAILSTGTTSLVATLEEGRAEALRFLQVTPQPIATKWLLFLPFGAAGILIALASLTVMPPLAALTLLGCWCWATAVGHWCAGRALHILLAAWLLSFVPLVVAALTYDSGSWAPAAATALALGSVGWLASPRARVPALTVRAGAAGGRSGARPVRHAVPRWTALRMLFLTEIFARRGLTLLLILPMILFQAMALLLPLSSANGIVMVMAFSGMLASANTPAVRDFLATRPITRGQKLRGLILPWCLLVAVVPAISVLSAATATTIDRGQIRLLAYPRDVVRAALSPVMAERAAQAGTEITVSPALRRLLLGHTGRVALVNVGCFASLAAWNLGARARRRRGQRSIRSIRSIAGMALLVASFALMVPFCLSFWRVWTPSFWLVAPVDSLCVLILVREIGRLDAGSTG